MRVLDVEKLGYPAAVVTIDGERMLLLDTALGCDERIDVLSRVMAPA